MAHMVVFAGDVKGFCCDAAENDEAGKSLWNQDIRSTRGRGKPGSLTNRKDIRRLRWKSAGIAVRATLGP
jgi:hypothetical protein